MAWLDTDFFAGTNAEELAKGEQVERPAGSNEQGRILTPNPGAEDYSFDRTQEGIDEANAYLDRAHVLQRDEAMGRGLTTGLTFGAGTPISDLREGLATYFANKVDVPYWSDAVKNSDKMIFNIDPSDLENQSLLETLGTMRDARVKLGEDYPATTLISELVSSLGTGLLGSSKFAGTKLGQSVAGPGLKQAAKRTGIASGSGAGMSVGMEAGSGRAETPQDLVIAAAAGGLGGAGGQLLGEAIAPGARIAAGVANPILETLGITGARNAAEEVGALRAGSKMFGGEELPSHPQGYKEQLGAQADPAATLTKTRNLVNSLDPAGTETLADRNPYYKDVAEIETTKPSSAAAASDFAQRSEKLLANKERAARDLLNSAAAPEKNAAQAKKAFDEARAALKPLYDEVLDKGDEAMEAFPTIDDLAKDLDASFGKDNLSNAKLRDEISARMVAKNPRTDEFNFGEVLDEAGEDVHVASPRSLLSLKKEIDSMIVEQTADGAPALNKEAVRTLVDYKKKIDSYLGEIMPDYPKVAKQYADEAVAENARKMGREMFARGTGKNADDVSVFKDYFKSLTPAEQHYFREGAVDYIANIDAKKDTGPYAYLKGKFGREVTDSMYLDKLKVLLGPARVRQLIGKTEKLTSSVDHANKLTKNVKTRAGKENLSDNMMSKMVDAAAVLVNAFKDRLKPSSRSVVPGRRLAASPDTVSSSIITDITTGTKGTANDALAKIEDAIKARDTRGSLIPGILGGAIANQTPR